MQVMWRIFLPNPLASNKQRQKRRVCSLREKTDTEAERTDAEADGQNMRELNARQKKLLREWFEKNKWTCTFMFTIDQLPNDLYVELQKLNDHETIVQNIERFIHDLVAEDMMKADKNLGSRSTKQSGAK